MKEHRSFLCFRHIYSASVDKKIQYNVKNNKNILCFVDFTLLVKSLDNLTEKERRVIELYYYEDLTLKEISNILEVSESRVSQLHTKGLIKMRKVMGPYMNILTNA